MSGLHAPLAPSSMPRAMLCAASIELESMFPELEDTLEAAEGTASHWAGAELRHGRDVDVGLVAGNGVVLNDEMIEGAEMYNDRINRRVPVARGLQFHTEEPVSVTYLHPQMWGTPDCWAYDAAIHKLYVWDYKYGHRFVEVFENWQLLAYVCGILTTALRHLQDSDIDPMVEMVVIQPRCYHRDGPDRAWTIRASALRGYFNRMANQLGRIMDDTGAFRPGALATMNPECLDCRGRRACPVLHAEALSALALSGTATPFQLNPVQLGTELRVLYRAQSALEARVSGLEEQAIVTISGGTAVPWLKMESSEGREEWTKPVQEVIAAGQLMGVDVAKPAAVVTPAQARQAGLAADLVAMYSRRKRGALKLVEDDGTQDRKIFMISN